MSELADRLPGEIILASYNNDQRDRLVERYVDATARQASTPLPVAGTVSYLTSSAVFSIFDGSVWIDYETVPRNDATLAPLLAQVYSGFFALAKTLTSATNVVSMTVPEDGDYEAFFHGQLGYDPDLPTPSGAMGGTWTFWIDGGPTNNGNWSTSWVNAEIQSFNYPLYMAYQFVGLTAGQVIHARFASASQTGLFDIRSYYGKLQGVPLGVMPGRVD